MQQQFKTSQRFCCLLYCIFAKLKLQLKKKSCLKCAFMFQKPQLRPMIAEYDPKSKDVRHDLIMVK